MRYKIKDVFERNKETYTVVECSTITIDKSTHVYTLEKDNNKERFQIHEEILEDNYKKIS